MEVRLIPSPWSRCQPRVDTSILRMNRSNRSHLDAVKLFNEDPETEAIILIGEIGGTAEEEAAAFIKEHVDKPCAAFIAGRTAPPGRRMGHAGAIVSGGKGTAEAKVEALLDAGISVAETPSHMAEALFKVWNP